MQATLRDTWQLTSDSHPPPSSNPNYRYSDHIAESNSIVMRPQPTLKLSTAPPSIYIYSLGKLIWNSEGKVVHKRRKTQRNSFRKLMIIANITPAKGPILEKTVSPNAQSRENSPRVMIRPKTRNWLR